MNDDTNKQRLPFRSVWRMIFNVILEILLFIYLSLGIYLGFARADTNYFTIFIGNGLIIGFVILFDEMESRWLDKLIRKSWFRRLPSFLQKYVLDYHDMPKLVTALYLFYALIIIGAQISIHYPDLPFPTIANTPHGLLLVTIEDGTFGDWRPFFTAAQSSLLLLVALHKGTDALAAEIRRRRTAPHLVIESEPPEPETWAPLPPVSEFQKVLGTEKVVGTEHVSRETTTETVNLTPQAPHHNGDTQL